MTPDVADLVGAVEDLVARAAAVDPGDLPREVADHVGLVLADCVGVMAAGSRSPEIVALAAEPALRLATVPAPGAVARTMVPSARYGDPATVAWLNGTAGTFLELDEGFRPTGHPAIHVVPAAFATAESVGAPGCALVAAIVTGYEVAARLFETFVLPAAMHPHGHFGAIAAATAVARLTGADPVASARIAATQPLLTGWDACYEGATARNTWSGHANRVGVVADMLRRAGFTGSLASHLSVVGPYATSPGALREPVTATTLRVRRNYFKFHSACALTHSTLDAFAAAWAALPIGDPSAVTGIEVTTVPANLRVAHLPAPNALSARFSLPYAVAAAALNGSTGPESFVWRPEVAEFAERVTVVADPEMAARWPHSAPARVVIRTATGISAATVDNPRGHHTRPVTGDELREKFVALGGTGACFDALADVTGVADCSDLPVP